MELVIVIVAVVVLGLAAMVAAGKFGEMKAEPVRDVYQPPVPADRELDADDLEQVRFGVQARGYDMAEVDDLMARMARELDERDRRISELGQGRVPGRGLPIKADRDRAERLDDDRSDAGDQDSGTPTGAEPSRVDDQADADRGRAGAGAGAGAEVRQKAARWRGTDEDESDWERYRPNAGSSAVGQDHTPSGGRSTAEGPNAE